MLKPAATLVDPQGRVITYLRMSIIDRCNLRCYYCMPKAGVPRLPKTEVLTLEEIIEVGEAARDLGITKLRITGGEPLIKRGVVRIVRELAALSGIRKVALTTNGLRLARYAEILKTVGLSGVNVSLDTLDAAEYRRITRGGDITRVFEGIDAALEVGLPVKVNAVLSAEIGGEALDDWIEFATQRGVAIRFVERMGFDREVPFAEAAHLRSRLGFRHQVAPLPPDPDSPHVQRYRCDGAELGFISPRSRPFCGTCNKLRLTARGWLMACLASDVHVDLKAILRAPHDKAPLYDAFRRVVSTKPSQGSWSVPGTMWQVGG